jgi:hypothetical protein
VLREIKLGILVNEIRHFVCLSRFYPDQPVMHAEGHLDFFEVWTTRLLGVPTALIFTLG